MKKFAQYSFALIVSLLTLACFAAEEFNDSPENTIATPTKMAQSIKDVPSAVTVIEGDTIRRLGFTNVPDILRLAPGFVTAQGNAWDYRVDYHGSNNFNSRRMQVLVDGMSVYRSGLAKVDWLMLPVPIKDIDRIEVTRSPSSASYGANAFQAVVNIITREAKQNQQFSADTQRSSRGLNQSYLHFEDKTAKTGFAISAEHTKSDGFYLQQQRRLDSSTQVYIQDLPPYLSDDGYEFSKLTMSGQYQIDTKNTAKLSVGGVRSLEDQHGVAHYAQLSKPNSSAWDNFINFNFTSDSIESHRLKLEANRYQSRYTREWLNCYPSFLLAPELKSLFDLNPNYADTLVLKGAIPTGGTAADDQALQIALNRYYAMGASALTNDCGTINQNYVDSKNTLEIQDTWAISETVRAVTGVGIAHNATTSQTFLGGTVELNKRWIYTNAEWRPNTDWTVNIGTMLERDSINQTLYAMPRAAVGYDILPNQTIKYVVASSRRAPDLTETNLYWSIYVVDLQTPIEGANSSYYYRHASTKNKLVAERDLSHSIVWLGRAPDFGLSYEIKLFTENMDKLISENFGSTEYMTNNGKVNMSGAEYQIRYKILPELTLLNTYAYLIQDANNVLETALYARHSGSVALLADIGKYQMGFAYYGTDFKNSDTFDQFDFLVGRKYQIAGGTLYWQGKLEYLPNNSFSQTEAAVVRYTSVYRRESAAVMEIGVDW